MSVAGLDNTPLRRAISLPQLILYGLGTTIGAGVYALIGEIAAVAGYLAPWSFVAAALLAGLTGISFAVMSSRFPRAAGIALYIEQGIGSKRLALLVGILAIMAGVVSSAALLNGLVGYAQEFVAVHRLALIVVTAVIVVAVASWGIGESVWLAAVITVIEIAGLVWASVLAMQASTLSADSLNVFVPESTSSSLPVVIAGAVLAFYAYIGFEDMIEVAEEVSHVQRNLPIAIVITLIVSTGLYVVLVSFALLATGPDFLASSSAPFADLFRELSEVSPLVISGVALLAILNGALIQVIMASRILYGLASRSQLPAFFGVVNRRTQTPINATLAAGGVVILLAVSGGVAALAMGTSIIILILFALVNLSLALLEQRRSGGVGHYLILATSWLGALACTAMVIEAVFG